MPHREQNLSAYETGMLTLITAERNAALEQLKVFGRNPVNAEPIFTKDVRAIELYDRNAGH